MLFKAFRIIVIVWFAFPALANPDQWSREWPDTDFDVTTIGNWGEIMSGGPGKDGIPSLTAPNFIGAFDETRLGDREPVIAVEIEGEIPRAYPIRYLMWHEIVNDTVGEVPIAVTFCPLCNSGLTFDRRVNGQVLEFGVTGKLRNSDMVMYDRETQSWWQQAIGVGIVGEMTGVELEQLPTWMESWGQFRERNPEGAVMDEPNWRRNYGENPYRQYDTTRAFLYRGENPPHGIDPLARVIRVGNAAWPLERLREAGEMTESGYVFSWTEGQASALDSAEIASGREVGTIRVRNESGANVPHDVLFAFAFHAFYPDGDWMLGE